MATADIVRTLYVVANANSVGSSPDLCVNMLGPAELDDVYTFTISLAKEAGKLLLDGANARIQGQGLADDPVEKENAVDIVTQTDEDVERFIKLKIQGRYPNYGFLGEESYSKGQSRDYLVEYHKPTFVVDPLDGTVNYTHLFPMFCVSIGLVVEGRAAVGVIYAPFLNQLFSACIGRGAWLNETQQLPLMRNPVPPMPPKAPSQCVFACEWGKDRKDQPDGNMHRKVESFVNLAAELGGRDGKGGMVHGVRSLGRFVKAPVGDIVFADLVDSATLDLAYCAMGSFDIWWEGGCWEWDVAAGICVLQQAGGLVTTANPPTDPWTAPIVDAHLGGRLYLAIRPAGDSDTESGRSGQERTVREVWRRVRELDYARPGV